MATMSVLLSTVVSHHHHMDRICMVQEQCQEDGNINDEHTEHHDQESNTDRGNCRVHQMHHFVTNAKVVKGILVMMLSMLIIDVAIFLAFFLNHTDTVHVVMMTHHRR